MRIVLRSYKHLIITRSEQDEAILVLRPPAQDPRAILDLARVVLPESEYRELAGFLGFSFA
ncbi:MAG: hypothetical protein ACRDYU_00525 [Actinomycetes bacterium]